LFVREKGGGGGGVSKKGKNCLCFREGRGGGGKSPFILGEKGQKGRRGKLKRKRCPDCVQPCERGKKKKKGCPFFRKKGGERRRGH